VLEVVEIRSWSPNPIQKAAVVHGIVARIWVMGYQTGANPEFA
jgi:hypothetical protein